MADNTFLPLGDIRKGDRVASRNEFTGVYGNNPVTALLSSLHTDRVSVVIEETLSGKTETITTTLEHPFYVEGKGFLPAEELKAGMALSQWQPKQSPLQNIGYRAAETSGALLVKAITVERTGVPSWRAYNLTIANDHTYYVGHLKTWVHNAGPGDCFEKLPSRFREQLTEKTAFGQKQFRDPDTGQVVYKGHDGRFYDPNVTPPTKRGTTPNDFSRTSELAKAEKGRVTYTREGGGAKPDTPAFDYDRSAPGSRTDGLQPSLQWKDRDGTVRSTRFDGVEGQVMIDRKWSIRRNTKAREAALRQSETLRQNGLDGRWEVPDLKVYKEAKSFLNKLGIKNIQVSVRKP